MTSSVLVVGAGIAGSTAAYWLARGGWRVTVVERSTGLRSSGAPVDVRGPAAPVVERMGLLRALRAAATSATRLELLDARGRRIGAIPQQFGSGTEIEVPRGALAGLLADACGADVEFHYDESATALADDGQGVDVTFERGAPARFDLVVGADGVHSRVRRLAFGPEERFVRHLGLYVATFALDGEVVDPHTVLMHNSPGRAVAIHPVTGQPGAAFIFRHPYLPGLDHRDVEQHKRIVRAAYAGGGWHIPELLDRMDAADDLYFDAVSRVRTDTWSRGRITLLGDAAACASLLGDGSSMAIAGAATLARRLTSAVDVPAALRAYESAHRPLVEARLRAVWAGAAFLVPATRVGLAARNLAVRLVPTGGARASICAPPLRREPRTPPEEEAMRTITAVESISLDGVMQGPGRPDEDERGGFTYGGWAAPFGADPEQARVLAGYIRGESDLLFGRRTYEDFFAVWPGRTDNPFTERLNAARKFVVSTTLRDPLPWANSVLLPDAAAVKDLRASDGPALTLLGSGELVRALLAADLVDALLLLVHPLVLGHGRRLFAETAPHARLRLVDTAPTGAGVLINHYVREGVR